MAVIKVDKERLLKALEPQILVLDNVAASRINLIDAMTTEPDPLERSALCAITLGIINREKSLLDRLYKTLTEIQAA